MDLALVDTTALRLGDWAAVTASLPGLALLAGIGLLGALALALLLTMLFRPGEPPSGAPAADEPAVAGSRDDSVRRVQSSSRAEAVPVVAGARAATARVGDPLHGVGFSPIDVIALRALRQRVLAGDVADGPTRGERLAFARWLVEHGRLRG
jgi:hypothetical protein